MQILNMILYTAITLGVLIFVHELGHFLAAKLTGMRVDRFSIGFPPRAFGKIIGDTDYCVSWIPVGGYVKIAGMIDESMDTEFLSKAPEPWEFRSKPLWARMIVISAGVVMNVLLAIGIFWGISYTAGKLTKETTVVGYVMEGTPAERAGFRANDSILSINGKHVDNWDDIDHLMYIENMGNEMTFEILRDGHRSTLIMPPRPAGEPPDKPLGLVVGYTIAVVKIVEPKMPAEAIGVKPGDVITMVDTTKVAYPRIFTEIKRHAGQMITITWTRDSRELSARTTVTKEGRIGVSIEGIYTGPMSREQYSFVGALPEGLSKTWESVYLFYLTISKIVAGKTTIKESLGGPIAIAQLATQSANYGISSFLGFMALLSMSLALINILPFPALDGGHLVMMIYEKIFRREIPQRLKIIIQQTGFILLLLLMAFVIYNDISRF